MLQKFRLKQAPDSSCGTILPMLKKIFVLILILIAVTFLLRDQILKQVIATVGSSVLGAPLKVGDFSLSLFAGQLSLKDVTLYNPSHFTSNPLIDIAHVDVRYKLSDLLKSKLYFSLIDLDIRQLAIEKNAEGQYNVSSLKIKPQKSTSEARKPLDMRIDLLRLNVDKVTLREQSKDGQVKQSSHGVGLRKKEFKNVTSPQQLVALVLFESSGLGPLKNLAMATTKEVVKDVGQVATGVVHQAKRAAGNILSTLKDVVHK